MDIVDILMQQGPQSGAELVKSTRSDVFELWSSSRKSPRVISPTAATRFLRLDRAVPGYARLSPSIRREFLTYTVLGLENQRDSVEARTESLKREIHEISRAKFELARETMEGVVRGLNDPAPVLERVCFIIAGDIAYNMSHTVPRPEKSTGQMVRGSDLDIVVVAEDELPASALNELDTAIHKRKHFLLVHPDYREEIDYVVKKIPKVQQQLRFDTFESMVACKILWEGQYLFGSERVFAAVKNLVEERQIARRLAELQRKAIENRDQAEKRLLEADAKLSDSESLHLFYTREEGEEIY